MYTRKEISDQNNLSTEYPGVSTGTVNIDGYKYFTCLSRTIYESPESICRGLLKHNFVDIVQFDRG